MKSIAFSRLCCLLGLAPLMALPLGAAQAAPAPQAAGNAAQVELFEPASLPPSIPTQTYASSATRHSVRLRFDALEAVEAGQAIGLQLTADDRWEGVVQRVERRNPGSYSLFGRLTHTPEGWFIFTIEGAAIVASFQLPAKQLLADLRNIQGDLYWLQTYDSRTTRGVNCGVQGAAAIPPGPRADADAPPTPNAPGDPVPQQDLMVLYTQGMVNDFPRHYRNTPLDTAIQHFVDFSNQSYLNSGVQLRLRLVYRGLIDPNFSEAGRTRETLLSMLTTKNDGFLDPIHNLRTTYHADLVCLLYSYDTQATGTGGGLAHLLGGSTFNANKPADWYPYGFSVVEGLWEPSSVEPPVSGMVPTEFVHEIGHNQGLDHNCSNADSLTYQVATYAFGWRFIGNSNNKYVTIMSYMTDTYTNASPIPHFSNPAVLFDGLPTGHATSAGCAGTTGARNAQVLNTTADYMSRLHLAPFDPWVDFYYLGSTLNGRFETPYRGLLPAINSVPDTNPVNTPDPPTLTFKGPVSTGPLSITISKRLRLKAHNGPVKIGGS